MNIALITYLNLLSILIPSYILTIGSTAIIFKFLLIENYENVKYMYHILHGIYLLILVVITMLVMLMLATD